MPVNLYYIVQKKTSRYPLKQTKFQWFVQNPSLKTNDSSNKHADFGIMNTSNLEIEMQEKSIL